MAVDDNFHIMDESERYTFGTYASLDEAIAQCQRIVDEFLEAGLKEGQLSAEALYRDYVACGPDPFIPADDPSITGVPFSAWTYAREQCFRSAAESGEVEAGR